MRITLVSAHYPPNFVSGGTLQPQRLARGLHARGHEVRVFAGHLDSTLRPLETWEEVDPTGLPVRWVVTTPWMDWADVANYDNERVAALFEEELAAHPADVVHLHALQTLGVGLIEVAKRSGAATVVTMHDFWWVCARQFLVDRCHRPCSLVVAAGDCPCEDGRDHLDRRGARLAEALGSADVVLAPSRSAADVLRANGVDPHRLEVDENGMDLPESGLPTAPTGAAAADTAVVVRYTGGSNPMKGADVLIEAVHALGPTAGLRVLAHDLDEAVERDGRSIEGTCLELLPPYGPAELDDVLAATDVLVLPSVMRESHSLVTREALLRRVPVLATDTIGPEEVVLDGVNGLIVPAADPALLRRALAALTDRSLLARLTEGTLHAPPVRSVDEQVEGLERRFEQVLATGGRTPPRAQPDNVLFVVGIDGAPLRYRARLPAEALALRGIASTVRHYRDPDVEERAAEADVVVVYRVPATLQVLGMIERRRARGAPVVFDVDDLIFDPELAKEIPALRLLPRSEADLWLEGVRRYRTTMEACDAYIGSTPRLVEHARSVVGIESHLFENGVGTALGAASDIALRRPRRPGPVRVGYLSGTTTHDDDWRHIEPSVLDVLERHPTVELWLGGHLQPTMAEDKLGARARRLPFLPWYELPGVLRDLDVNLAPLEPGSRFNDAKSAIKWLEAALVATPTIASPSAPFVDAIDDGRTGWLAEDEAQWTAVLDDVVTDAEARSLVGARARREALLRWSPHVQAERYVEILAAVRRSAGHQRRTPTPGWVPVAPDEPPERTPTQLEPYPPAVRGSIRRTRRHRRVSPIVVVRTKLRRLATSWREDGALETVRGAGRLGARVVRRLIAAPVRLLRRSAS